MRGQNCSITEKASQSGNPTNFTHIQGRVPNPESNLATSAEAEFSHLYAKPVTICSGMKFQISTPPYDSVVLLQLKDRLEICEAHLEKGSLALDLPRAKQSLAHHEEQLKDIENSAMRTFCRGEELIDFLKQSEIELRVKDPVTLENIDAQTHIYNLLEVLHSKRRDLRDLAEERKIKLEQNLLLRQLESDAKQVSPKFSF